ncbi:MAG: 3-hydroxyisobutyrate dehydrogenase [Dehalococcoidia bacterium]|nr:3-hydroxyisobutyrate dehydrogenase [Dehalococcoidia bacterium]MQG16190.1 NAD(P)-dependent oxidoreductase [SAR202 cluster bacterium]|tara:strand:+ start:6766 stop:7683 length:918 start_codon:yes stop_codon:yes gene_type:complete
MNIGWIGVGNIGLPMARHLIDAGHRLTVHDLVKDNALPLLEMGATWADSPEKASTSNEVVVMSLPMPDDVEKVCFGDNGILNGLKPGNIVVDMSTNSLEMVRSIENRFRKNGIEFLDSPVSGGVEGANSTDLVVLVGGSQNTFNKVECLLKLIGKNVNFCGPIGAGTICKLSHQLLAMSILQIGGEILTLGIKAGVDLDILADSISKGVMGKVPPLGRFYQDVFNGNLEGTDTSFYLGLAAKDIKLANDMARQIDVPLTIGSAVEEILVEAMNRGWQKKNFPAIVQLQEEKTGVELRTNKSVQID